MSTKRFLILAVLIAGASFLVGIIAAHYDQPPYPQMVAFRETLRGVTGTGADLEEGATIFRSQCAVCHGPDGKGGRGPDLTRGNLTDPIITRAVYDGIPGTEMPGSWMPNESRKAIVGYVLSLADPESAQLDPGRVEAGRGVFEAQNCSTCHVVVGEDARLAPSLQGVGNRRSAEHLRSSVVEPSRFLSTGFEPVSVTEQDGTLHTGFLLDKDAFSIRMRDASGQLRAFSLEDAALERLDTSLMPSYGDALSDQELSDLVTYLSSLR